MIATIGVDDAGPGLQRQRRHRGRRHRRGARRPRSSCTSPTSPGVYGDFPDESTPDLARSTSTASSSCSAGGTVDEGMIPKLASCVHGAAQRRARAHILDGRIPHALLLEFFTREGIGTMVLPMSSTMRRPMSSTSSTPLDAEHVMQTYGRLPVAFVRGEGSAAVGQRGQASTSTSSAASRSRRSATPTPRWPTRIADQARTLLHVSNLYSTTCSRRLARARSTRLTRRRRAGVLRQLGRRGQRVRDQAGPPVRAGARRPDRFHVLSALRLVPRPHAHDARRHRPARRSRRRSSRCPTGSARSRSPTSTRSAAAMDERVCRRPARAVQGEGGVQPAPPGYLRGACARCATSARRC